MLFNFYPFLQKYMQPHQKKVTSLLTFLAQASHDLVPPDILMPCIKTLADHFVTDRSSGEIMAVGLNAIREVCARCPLAMEKDLLQDLAQYKSSKQKGVMMAARSLVALFREINPELLIKKDRGRTAQMNLSYHGSQVLEYGESRVYTDFIGADLLQGGEVPDVNEEDDEEGMEDQQPELYDDGQEDNEQNEDSDDEDMGEPENGEATDQTILDEKIVPLDRKIVPRNLPIGATRMFSQEEFERIAELRERDAARPSRKRHREDGSSLGSTGVSVEEDDIVGFRKKVRQTYDDRMASILEGREGRRKYNQPKEKGGGSTNQDKLKSKPHMMVKHKKSIQGKKFKVLTVKQRNATKHIKNLKKAAGKKKGGRR
jgi:protein SDA1